MSCKVNFHIVGSALQNSMCLLVFKPHWGRLRNGCFRRLNETSLTGGHDLLLDL